ncbi:hypothetical protein [uncultured Pelagimonas sp.]|uniref:DUF3885 domain-containing protein n=1 Tax=uncultured Pelagimonas sp. TaxID=1618102 RepID=UPI00261931C6|nr:hypothetical protein [uncultured Pelagimonas sp.]
MTKPGFSGDWKGGYGSTLPIGHILRHEHGRSWTRFHALPGSKRYADTTQDQHVILERAEALSIALFDGCADLWLVSVVFLFGTDAPKTITLANDTLVLELQSCASPTADTFDDDVTNIGIYAKQVDLNCQGLPLLWHEIAEDVKRALLFDPVSHRVFAPYDGGFDLFLESGAPKRDFEAKFPDWMPSTGGNCD